MHKFIAAFGLFMALSAVTVTQAEAREPYYYCKPTTTYRPPVFREPNWYRYRESYGGFKSYDYHESRGEYSMQRDWRSTGYNANFGHGQTFDEHVEEHVRYPGHTLGYGRSPIFP